MGMPAEEYVAEIARARRTARRVWICAAASWWTGWAVIAACLIAWLGWGVSILESLETELAEIEAALQRIDAGTYGIDEVTGDPIDPERLDAIPTARTNITGGAHPHDATHGSGAEPI